MESEIVRVLFLDTTEISEITSSNIGSSGSRDLNPLADDNILDRSNLKQSADDNFKFDENSRKFSKRVENTVGKGKIARYEQFFLFPQCFQTVCFLGASKGVIEREWVKLLPRDPASRELY